MSDDIDVVFIFDAQTWAPPSWLAQRSYETAKSDDDQRMSPGDERHTYCADFTNNGHSKVVITLITTRDKLVTLVACHDPAFNEINDGREGTCEFHCWNSYVSATNCDWNAFAIRKEHVQFASNCMLHVRWHAIVRHSVKHSRIGSNNRDRSKSSWQIDWFVS